MKTRDKEDEQQRHAQRNFVIHEVRSALVNECKYSFGQADALIGKIWGLSVRKIQEIEQAKVFCAVAAHNLSKIAVLLQRISEKMPKEDEN